MLLIQCIHIHNSLNELFSSGLTALTPRVNSVVWLQNESPNIRHETLSFELMVKAI